VLVLTRRAGESIVIGDDVRVVVLDVRGETVRIGIEAPRSVQVHRAEIYAEVQAANAAALAGKGDLGSLTGHLAALARPGPRPRPPRDAARGTSRDASRNSSRDASRDAAAGPARRMVRMSEGDRLERVQDKIDEAKDAAAAAEEDLLPRAASPADPRSAEGGAFEPSGDDGNAGENPQEGAEADAPGDPARP
jgi:carbon storage regulator